MRFLRDSKCNLHLSAQLEASKFRSAAASPDSSEEETSRYAPISPTKCSSPGLSPIAFIKCADTDSSVSRSRCHSAARSTQVSSPQQRSSCNKRHPGTKMAISPPPPTASPPNLISMEIGRSVGRAPLAPFRCTSDLASQSSLKSKQCGLVYLVHGSESDRYSRHMRQAEGFPFILGISVFLPAVCTSSCLSPVEKEAPFTASPLCYSATAAHTRPHSSELMRIGKGRGLPGLCILVLLVRQQKEAREGGRLAH